jgi:putative FmdB family regulatory protein
VPYYDFRCRGCGGTFELQRSVARRDEASCPTCGSADVQRLLPVVVAYVKGSGGAAEGGCCGGADEEGGCCGGACACAAQGAADAACSL